MLGLLGLELVPMLRWPVLRLVDRDTLNPDPAFAQDLALPALRRHFATDALHVSAWLDLAVPLGGLLGTRWTPMETF